ncbi:hypothetical protein DFJ73DRAFT_902223 [Zopfochytrium polystomum]|nr:hypothetical protein DFJ73DRAFT_902223 [Zopfochytrium polystomum]
MMARKSTQSDGAVATSTSPSTRTRTHRRVSIDQANRHALVLFVTNLLLVAIALLATGSHAATNSKNTASTSGSSRAFTGSRVKTVGGVTVQVGPKIKVDINQHADVLEASTDGQTNNAVYKKYRQGESMGKHEVAATSAAGHLISAEGNQMIQHKVGEMGLTEYLQQASKDPAAKKTYQDFNANFLSRLGKPKLSDHINKQILKQQKQIGYAHLDPGGFYLKEPRSQIHLEKHAVRIGLETYPRRNVLPTPISSLPRLLLVLFVPRTRVLNDQQKQAYKVGFSGENTVHEINATPEELAERRTRCKEIHS